MTQNRIDKTFAQISAQKKKALIAFITSGDPSIDATYEFALSLFDAGVDILELGVPFSDPVAEGPVIEAASGRALAAGFKTDRLFEMTKKLRAKTDKPILFMLYINSIYAYGASKFFSNCRDAGIDGVIVPDLPYEEQNEIAICEDFGIYSIRLIAPTGVGRIEKITESAKGFLYCVSSEGVTGTRSGFSTDFEQFSKEIKTYGNIPAAVGFGIGTPDQARELSKHFDGVIMGSAFVKLIAMHGENAAEHLHALAKNVKNALI